jgi:hypothetical protein
MDDLSPAGAWNMARIITGQGIQIASSPSRRRGNPFRDRPWLDRRELRPNFLRQMRIETLLVASQATEGEMIELSNEAGRWKRLARYRFR